MSKIGIGGGGDEPGLGAWLRARFAEKEAVRRRTQERRDVEEARKRAREAERLKKGRRASILTSSRGVTEPLGVARRPRASALLGGE